LLPEEFTLDEEPSTKWVARLVIMNGKQKGRSVNVEGDRFTIGRSFICNLTLDCKQASRKHAEIIFKDGKYTLRDLDSRWGTRFKGQPIKEVSIQFGDEFEIAGTLIKFDYLLESKVALARRVKQQAVRLTLVYGEADTNVVELEKDQFVIGRDETCDFRLFTTRVSPKHAQIVYEEGEYKILDLKSESGVYVNDERVDEATLQFGDEIIIDGNILKFDIFSVKKARLKKIARIVLIIAVLLAAFAAAYYYYVSR